MDNTVTAGRAIDQYKGKFILKPCKKSWIEQFDPKHSGAYLFEGAKIFLSPERDRETGLIKTGLTRQEQTELERELGLKEMELSPYSEYWNRFKLYPVVTQDGLTLDLDRSAMDKLRYLFCRVNSKVALSSADALENPMAEVLLTSTEGEAKIGSTKIKSKLDAMKKLSSLTIQEQMDFLKVFDGGVYKVSNNASADFILNTIGKVADEFPDKFLDLLSNPEYKSMIFLQECVQAGLVKKAGPKYIINGGDQLGNSLSDAIANLEKPEYNEVKIGLKAKLQVNKDKS